MNVGKLKGQQGMTLIGLSMLLGLIAFFTLLILKISPLYMDHSKVQNVFSAVEETDGLQNKSKHEIETMISKRFNINYVTHVNLSDVAIIKRPGYVRVELEYERVAPIAGNLSVLTEFYEEIEVGGE